MKMRKRMKNLRTLLNGGVPRQVIFAITSHCNMTCTTCSFPRIPRKLRRHVPLEDAKKAIDFFSGQDVRLLSITGGEPLLHPDFIEICKYASDKGMLITYIATNGKLVSDGLAAQLAGTSVNYVGLSLDVVDSRGRGITRKDNIRKTVSDARKILEDHGIDTFAGVVLGTHITDVRELVRLAEELGFDKITFSYPQTSMDSSYMASSDAEVLKGDAAFWTGLVEDILHQKRWNWRVDIYNTRVNLQEFLKIQCGETATYQCPGGSNHFYVDWDLNVFRCLNSGSRLGQVPTIGSLEADLGDCGGCTQQAHLDWGSFYTALDVLTGIKASVAGGDLKGMARIIGSGDNRKAMGSLLEVYLGGFV